MPMLSEDSYEIIVIIVGNLYIFVSQRKNKDLNLLINTKYYQKMKIVFLNKSKYAGKLILSVKNRHTLFFFT